MTHKSQATDHRLLAKRPLSPDSGLMSAKPEKK